ELPGVSGAAEVRVTSSADAATIELSAGNVTVTYLWDRESGELRRRINQCESIVLGHSPIAVDRAEDRKSTRLNSSHVKISYAVLHAGAVAFPTRRSSDLSCRASPAQQRFG